MKTENLFYHWLERNYGIEDWKIKFTNYIERVKQSCCNDDVKTGVKMFCKEHSIKLDKMSEFIRR